MAFIQTCGFEDNAPVATTGYEVYLNSPSGAMTIQSSVKRSGDYAARYSGSTSGLIMVPLGYPANGSNRVDSNTSEVNIATSFWLRVYVRIATRPSSDKKIIGFHNLSGGTNQGIWLNSSGDVWYTNLASPTITSPTVNLALNTWYRIELQLNNAAAGAGSYEFRVDGTTIGSQTGISYSGNSLGAVAVGPASVGGDGMDIYYDDLAVSDSAFPGAGACVRLDPDGNGIHTAWVAGTGSGGFGELDDTPPHDSDTTYVTTSTNTQKESVTCETMASAGATSIGSISVVKYHAAVRDNNQTCNWSVGGAGVGHLTTPADNPSGTAYYTRQYIRVTDPATSAAWTESGVNSAEPTVMHNQSQSRPLNCTQLCLMVEYVPLIATIPNKIYSVTAQSRIRASHH